MGIFIQIEIDTTIITPPIRQQLARICPVDIFTAEGIAPENEDECTLCELCLGAAPAGGLRIRKLYKDETLVSTGG